MLKVAWVVTEYLGCFLPNCKPDVMSLIWHPWYRIMMSPIPGPHIPNLASLHTTSPNTSHVTAFPPPSPHVTLIATALHLCYFPSTCILWGGRLEICQITLQECEHSNESCQAVPGKHSTSCLLLLILLSKVVLTVESVFAILKCDQSKESCTLVLSLLSWRTVSDYAAQLSVQWGFNFGVCRCSP